MILDRPLVGESGEGRAGRGRIGDFGLGLRLRIPADLDQTLLDPKRGLRRHHRLVRDRNRGLGRYGLGLRDSGGRDGRRVDPAGFASPATACDASLINRRGFPPVSDASARWADVVRPIGGNPAEQGRRLVGVEREQVDPGV